MDYALYNLAIETSSRNGSVTMGRDAEMLATIELSQRRRHNVELMPAIDELFRRQHALPRELGHGYVSIGPGSFTGLRNAVATAKMLAMTLGVKIVAVPTLDVIVQNAPADQRYVAVCLNAKRRQTYSGIYEREDTQWRLIMGPKLIGAAELLEAAPRPLAVLGDRLPDVDWPAGVEILDESLATPRSEAVWRLGRAMAGKSQFADAHQLVPLYARRPEAEELWAKRQATSASS